MQFLFYIAVADMLALFISGVADRISGVGWRRLLYCAKIHYLMGSWSVCLWITESTAEMVLAFNRCVEVSSSYWADVLFHGKRTYLLYFLLFTTPGLFSGLFGSWFFNPHVDYIDDFGKTYHNDLHTIHNYTAAIVSVPTLQRRTLQCPHFSAGTLHVLALKCTGTEVWALKCTGTEVWALKCASLKTLKLAAASHVHRKSLQVILISLVNATTAFLFVYMQFVRVSQFLIGLAQLAWILSHDIPPIIYLLLNKTFMRNPVADHFNDIYYRITPLLY
uniref:G-protein coupled receptors family 1 profile domain-containing protein n=1 Tax=Globodera rostochiensis TaxID=31243 RepID=A0A914IG34_GLORO